MTVYILACVVSVIIVVVVLVFASLSSHSRSNPESAGGVTPPYPRQTSEDSKRLGTLTVDEYPTLTDAQEMSMVSPRFPRFPGAVTTWVACILNLGAIAYIVPSIPLSHVRLFDLSTFVFPLNAWCLLATCMRKPWGTQHKGFLHRLLMANAGAAVFFLAICSAAAYGRLRLQYDPGFAFFPYAGLFMVTIVSIWSICTRRVCRLFTFATVAGAMTGFCLFAYACPAAVRIFCATGTVDLSGLFGDSTSSPSLTFARFNPQEGFQRVTLLLTCAAWAAYIVLVLRAHSRATSPEKEVSRIAQASAPHEPQGEGSCNASFDESAQGFPYWDIVVVILLASTLTGTVLLRRAIDIFGSSSPASRPDQATSTVQTTTPPRVPTQGRATPPSGKDFIAIGAGWYHCFALKSDGSIVAWGDNYYGEAKPPSGNHFIAIAAGHDYSLALKSGGSIVGWGRNDWGQATPPSGNDFIAIAAGGWHSLALKFDGSIVDWGLRSKPPSGNDFIAIAAGGSHGLALKSDGSIVGWGKNDYAR